MHIHFQKWCISQVCCTFLKLPYAQLQSCRIFVLILSHCIVHRKQFIFKSIEKLCIVWVQATDNFEHCLNVNKFSLIFIHNLSIYKIQYKNMLSLYLIRWNEKWLDFYQKKKYLLSSMERSRYARWNQNEWNAPDEWMHFDVFKFLNWKPNKMFLFLMDFSLTISIIATQQWFDENKKRHKEWKRRRERCKNVKIVEKKRFRVQLSNSTRSICALSQ